VTIPVRNIYYLLLYAWGHFRGGVTTAVDVEDSPDLPNLLARVLHDGVQRLLRRGLDRGYVSEIEETRSLRGRVQLGAVARQQTLRRGTVICELDELTHDVLHNRIIKNTLFALAASESVERKLRHEIRLLCQRLPPDISSIRLSSSDFSRVQLSRSTSQYGFLLKLCHFVFMSLMPSEGGLQGKFQSILEDETRMSALFEEFLRNFYRIELTDFSTSAEIMPWQSSSGDLGALDLLPVMKTDLTIRGKDKTVVIDAKYYKEILARGRHGSKLRSSHLYQLHTYLAHVRAQDPTQNVRGALIYPSSQAAMKLKYELLGTPVMVATIDLNQGWKEIHLDLLRLFDEI
jgi:5-methylcytosine-specific restriction enzyme subunit McrC